jgi:hypothetical protein
MNETMADGESSAVNGPHGAHLAMVASGCSIEPNLDRRAKI